MPTELRVEITRAASLAIPAWVEARERSDYALLLPHLEQGLELRRRYVECFDGYDEPYDVLLDDFEEGLRTARAREVLGRLRDLLRPLIAAVAERADAVDASVLHGRYPRARAARVRRAAARGDRLRPRGLAPGRHRPPVRARARAAATPASPRAGTRTTSGSGVFAALHECGHALYDGGVDPALERTPLGDVSASMSLHESQSRLWENVVGRSRHFWRHWFGPLREAFPEQLAGADAEGFYRAVNASRPP